MRVSPVIVTSSTAGNKAITILWRIENARLIQKKINRFGLQSPDFRCANALSKRIYLFWALEGPSKVEERLSVFPSGPPFDFSIVCEVSFLDIRGRPLLNWTVKNYLFNKSQPLSLPKFKSEEVFETRKSDYFLNGALTVRCRIWKSYESFMDDEFISAISTAEQAKHCVFWNFHQFSKLNLNAKDTRNIAINFLNYSIIFELNWILEGESIEEAEVKFEMQAYGLFQPVEVKIILSWLNDEKTIIKDGDIKTEIIRSSPQDSTICMKIGTRQQLLSKLSDYSRNDVLILHGEFSAVSGFTSSIQKQCHGILNVTELTKLFLESNDIFI